MTDLKSILADHYDSLSKNHKKIADAILNDPDRVAFLTANELASYLNTSYSTVMRFANCLGFDGYLEFQKTLQKYIKTQLTPHQRIEVSTKRVKNNDLLTTVMQLDIQRIHATLQTLDRNEFIESAKSIAQAKHVYIIGVRSSSTLASFLHFNLSYVRDQVRLLQPNSSSEIFEQLLDIQADDVLICISFPRYSAKIVNAIHYAHTIGANVISITDSDTSPIAKEATHLLIAQSDMVSFADSLVAPLSLINALIAETTEYIPEATERIDRLEHIWDEYNVYSKI